jgi:predicted Zn-dependent protease
MSPLAARDVVERALRSARCDECVVIADETSSANLRWAGNTLTTNGVARSRQLTVVAISRGRGGPTAGVVSRAGVRDEQIESVVREAEQAAAQGTPAEDASPLIAPDATGAPQPGAPGWDDPVEGTGISVFGAFAPALGEAFGQAAAGGRRLYGFAEHVVTSTFLGSSAGLRLRHDQPTGKVELQARTADLGFLRYRRRGDGGRPGHAAGLGEAPGRPAGRPVRDPAAAVRGGRPVRVPVLVRRGEGRDGRADGVQPARRRDTAR